MTLARFVAQRARLVERALVAGAHEAAVALEGRQFVGERARQARRQWPDRAAAAPRRAARSRRACRERGEPRRRARPPPRMPSRMAARSRGPPRPTTSRASARARSGAALQALAHLGAQAPSSAKTVDGVEPARDRRRIGQRRGEPLRQAAASRPPSRCGRWRRAASRAARRRACASVRDWRASPGRSRASRRRPRAPAATAAGACRAACARHR